MEIQNLIRDKVIGIIKTGTKSENGLPKKLSYFNVEEDKATSSEMVDIFKQMYPNNPTKLKIRFVSENPFDFKFKRYVKGKAVCIGNDVKAITVGKDEKGHNIQIERECNENCEQRRAGTCKLIGSLKFVLEGLDAGGVWMIKTSGGFSLSNIATEIFNLRKVGEDITKIPFELTLSAQESLAYGTYYSIDLRRTDIKPQLTVPGNEIKNLEIEAPKTVLEIPAITQNGTKQDVIEIENENKKEEKTPKSNGKKEGKVKAETTIVKNEEEKASKNNEKEQDANEDEKKTNSNYLTIKGIMPEMINGHEFKKIIFTDNNKQDIEYVVHPKAKQDILNYALGTIIELKSSTMEQNHNIICNYELVSSANENKEELKKAV